MLVKHSKGLTSGCLRSWRDAAARLRRQRQTVASSCRGRYLVKAFKLWRERCQRYSLLRSRLAGALDALASRSILKVCHNGLLP